ncbi:hypothetical protein QYF36_024777 [Acer negundo]|nr:hypothetical protein QYF36_024777 [Acer negundo]
MCLALWSNSSGNRCALRCATYSGTDSDSVPRRKCCALRCASHIVQSFQVAKLALQQESFEANIQDAENTLVAMKKKRLHL